MDIQGFVNIGAMGGSCFHDHPEIACRPFDRRHEGFIYGQASACVILESKSSCSKRGVSFLAEMKTGVLNLDGNASSDPNLEGEKRAMMSALIQSNCSPSDIDYLNAHGSSSPLGDETEAEAISQVFGKHTSDLWVNSTKGLIGHCLYSAGLSEAIATVIQMNEGFLHPNINLEEPIRTKLKFCTSKAVKKQIKTAMSNSFGFGGINTSIVLYDKTAILENTVT